jgi:hypothetical protein
LSLSSSPRFIIFDNKVVLVIPFMGKPKFYTSAQWVQ